MVRHGCQYKQFYAISSAKAVDKYVGGVAEYGVNENNLSKSLKKVKQKISYKMFFVELYSKYLYVGTPRLKKLTKRTSFISLAEQENKIYNYFT